MRARHFALGARLAQALGEPAAQSLWEWSGRAVGGLQAATERHHQPLEASGSWRVAVDEAEWSEWERWLDHIASAASGFPSVTTAVAQPDTRADMSPRLSIEWDADQLGIEPGEVQAQLAAGEPRIELNSSARGIAIMAYTMEPGEDAIIASRLCEILQAANTKK